VNWSPDSMSWSPNPFVSSTAAAAALKESTRLPSSWIHWCEAADSAPPRADPVRLRPDLVPLLGSDQGADGVTTRGGRLWMARRSRGSARTTLAAAERHGHRGGAKGSRRPARVVPVTAGRLARWRRRPAMEVLIAWRVAVQRSRAVAIAMHRAEVP
jgi:hypothetical protein